MSWNEERLHQWMAGVLAPRSGPPGSPGTSERTGRGGSAPGVLLSFGDDAALLRALRGRPVVCLDQTVAGVHFDDGASPAKVGRKAAARVLSDLAASAARPRALLLGLALEDERTEPWVRAVVRAVQACAREFGAELAGGDLARSPGTTVLSVAGLGDEDGVRPPGRAGARPGDAVVLSGPTGGSRLGRHLRIEPRVELGRWLAERGATAMMDVSDGLARDASRLARRSGVRLELDIVPVHRDARRAARLDGRSPEEHALHDGEDHELIATLPAASVAATLRAARRKFASLRVIGSVAAGRGLWLPGERGPVRWDGTGGWVHGT